MIDEPKLDTIVYDGMVVTGGGEYHAAVAIKDDKIAAIGDIKALPEAERYIDAAGKYILPGLIDCHVHLGAVDDWTVGPIAAAHGGITTIMPFQVFDPADGKPLAQVLTEVCAKGEDRSVLDFALHLILTNHPDAVAAIPDAFQAGVTSFKLFMTYKKRRNRMYTDAQILDVMAQVAVQGGLVQVHAENGDLIDYLENLAIAEGRVRPTDYPATAPPEAESEAVHRAIVLAHQTQCPLYIVHLSSGAGLAHIRRAREAGQAVWAETCPQYLLLDERAMERWGPLLKIGPPLRAADMVNQRALWDGLLQGTVSTVGSDHSVHPREAKDLGWENIFVAPDGSPVPFGAPSMETMVALLYSAGVVKRGLPLSWMVSVLAEHPARLFGLYPRKGTVSVGSDADLLIWDPTPERALRSEDLHGGAGYTPYENWTVHGRPSMTLLRGQILLNDGQLEQKPGYGRFLPSGKLSLSTTSL